MKFARIATKAIEFLYFFFRLRNIKLAYLFAHYHVELSAANVLKVKSGKLIFTAANNEINISSLHLFKLGFPFLLKVLNAQNVKVISSDKKGILLKVNNILMHASGHANMATIQEVFIESLYDFQHSLNDTVVLDIGMNTGYATLFFASMQQVDMVYAYEPFSGTFNEATENFNLNPGLAPKIKAFCYGISDTTGTVTVPLFEPGSTVGSTNKNFIDKNIFHSNSSQNTEVQIRSVDEVLIEIKASHPGKPIILKIDCEGEEYNIISKIKDTSQWNSIQAILMEWHIYGPGELLNTLTQNGFTCIQLPRIIDAGLSESKTGMIYAFRN